ncbi:conserved hypothetical protein [Histoplasma capsulatum H143]|uniref:Uncharacterized protein n=1 Tax=Ajellomyces capsulatus (strain H143) TaxID=544712 RepID=C6HBK1_AJECH|nr:conserved hypothetical protein [Histoplasma capsulatum H143]
MFGSQQPQIPSFYPPATSQPEWQQPPTNQAPGMPWQPADIAPPPQLPPRVSQAGASSYNPGTYGPMPGAGASSSIDQNIHSGFSPVGGDTTSWGVKFNHQLPHHRPQSSLYGNQSPGPPLPPRPSSAFDHGQSQSQSPVQATPWSAPAPTSTPPLQSNQQLYPQTLSMNISEHHSYYQQQEPWQTFQDPNAHSAQPIPPPPPPLPPAYQAEQQQLSQGQPPYSDQAPTRQYDDPTQQRPPDPATSEPPTVGQHASTGNGIYGQHQATPLAGFVTALSPPPNLMSPYGSLLPPASVAPVTPQSPPVVSTSSALGSGCPSDWEHFSAPHDEIDDTATFNFKSNVSPEKPNTYELPSATAPPALNGLNERDHVLSAENPQSHAVPELTRKPSPSPPVSPNIPARIAPDKPPPLNRADSLSSSVISTDDSTIIDGVIQAWSNPVPPKTTSVDATQPKDASSTSYASEQPHIPSSPSPRVHTPKHESPRSTTPKAEQSAPKTIIKVVDLYEDLDPWYKSSLGRYVTMLRKEMAAESDEERFKIFTHFLNKEAKLREILYGIEDTANTSNNEPTRNLSVRRQSLTLPALNTSKVSAPLEMGDDVVSYSPGGRPILASALSARGMAERTPAGDVNLRGRFTHRSDTLKGPQRGSGPLTFDRPAFQAYSALRQASVSSGRTLAHQAANAFSGASLESPSMGKAEHDETFIGLIREKSVAYRGRHRGSDPHTKLSGETSVTGNLRTIFDSLRDIIPPTLPNPAANPDVIELRKELEGIQDDFNFIQESIDAWDEQARTRRPELDRQRRVRQEESEHHIDGLFNDKEIGYSDINVLEDEFRETEAQRQLTEERKEFENYLDNVFNPIENRLKDDISRLQAQYDRAVDMLNADTATSDLLPGSPKTTKYELSHVMQIAVELFQKLEVRYAKQTEAIIDRERRRKKAERRYYVFLGETSSLKQLDQDFDAMEKSNIMNAAKEKDNRSNTLMDAFDDASMRGLGENQSVLDDIAGKVKRVTAQYLNILGRLPSNTEQIMASALALALMANLREALNITRRVGSNMSASNEDARKGRSSPAAPPIESIAEGPLSISSNTPLGPNSAGVEDDQQQRHRKALEDAKRRNAAKGIAP